MVHENWRFRPYYRRAGEWLRQARIGTIRSATMIVRGSGFRQDKNGRYPALDRQPFMRELPQMLVSEGLIHQIDVLRWLLGPLTVRFARLGRSCPKLLGEDRALIVMESASGVPAVLDADSAAAGYPARSADDLELIGTKGTIRFRDMELRLETEAKGEQFTYDAAEAYQASFDACIRHFTDCLVSGELFETNPRDNLATLRLVDEIYRGAGPLRMTLP